MSIRLKRAYDAPARNDGYRVLVDRVWPRGVSKEEADIDEWRKDIAPSPELRKWFKHDPEKWPLFEQRYFQEIDADPARAQPLIERARDGRLTLVFGAKDREHNNAVALKHYIEQQIAGA